MNNPDRTETTPIPSGKALEMPFDYGMALWRDALRQAETPAVSWYEAYERAAVESAIVWVGLVRRWS